MIDLHCHILPGIDDGPDTLEESVEIARSAVEDGVATIVATPHSMEWTEEASGEADIGDRVRDLSGELERQRLELQILPGVEVFLSPDTPQMAAGGLVFGLNLSRYLLVELPPQFFPSFAESVLFELQLRGLVPVIAHPERNAALAGDPRILQRLVERGMLAQVTAGSLTGLFGSRVRAAAETMLERGLVQVIASDAHSAVGRAPFLSAAVRRASELVGASAATAMVTSVPAAMLRDEDVDPPSPRPAQKRTWFPFSRK